MPITPIYINPNLLICAPMLQDYLVDATGLPLSNGTVTAYHDNARTILKNWYYQTGTPGNYTWVPLPNPLTLSAAGTICDVNGVDTLPFYYPYLETDDTVRDPYYFVIQNQDQTYTITRANFPYEPSGGPAPIDMVPTFENLIVNNRFWRNFGSATFTAIPPASNTGAGYYQSGVYNLQYNSTGSYYYITVAPSQHDGFSMPDINYIKNVDTATESISFNVLPNTVEFSGDVAPEYYINHISNATTGETLKVYQFPISLHLRTLSAIPFSFTIEGQSISGPVTLGVYIYEFLGTGLTSPAPIQIGSISLTSVWNKYFIEDVVFPAVTIPNNAGGDDAFYLQIGLPINTAFQLNLALPSIYLSANVPTNDFKTYDQIDGVIGTPRTGDIRTSLNSFYFYGWVPMNNGTIGNASSNATTRQNIDTWPLFNLIWNSFGAFSAGSSSSGTNPIAPMYTSTGTQVGYGAGISTSAIADFGADNQLSLTQSMGQVILGTVPLSSLLASATAIVGWQSTFAASSSGGLLLTAAHAVNFFNGMPIYFTTTGTLPTGITVGVIYYVANFNGTTAFNVATSFANAMSGTVITYTNAGTPPNTVISSLAGTFEGQYAHTQLIAELAAHTHAYAAVMGSGATVLGGATYLVSTQNTGTTGSSTPFNVTQPGIYSNIYIKL